MVTKQCVVCNTEFEAKRKHAKYCSIDCRNKRRVKSIVDYPPKTCLHCGKTFQPSKNNWRVAVYCSKICCSRAETKAESLIRLKQRPTIQCNECGITCKPKKSDGTTCGKRECVDESRRKTKLTNATKARQKGGHRYDKYREYQNKYSAKWKREKYRTDPKYNLSQRIRSSLRNGLKVIRKNAPTFKLLGYTVNELINHLESQFTEENGYSWDNMDEWHIDHIRPVSSFDYDSTDHPDFKKCWALNNLQPLWASDNISKKDKWDGVVNA